MRLHVAGRPALLALRRYPRLFDRGRTKRLFAVNFDIMVRTLALLLLFAWFANGGARLGTVQLAANAVLDQFVAVSAYVLDAFAFTAEARVGAAVGRKRSRSGAARDPAHRGILARRRDVFAVGTLFLVGRSSMRSPPMTRCGSAAYPYLPFVALIPLAGMPAWLFDGVYIGATWSRSFRNAAHRRDRTVCLAPISSFRPFGRQRACGLPCF